MDSQTVSSEALPENTQQNVCTRKGKYLIRLPKRNNIIVIGSNLCSKDIIQSDSFSFVFLIIYFGLCYIFNSLLLWIVNSGLHVPKEKVPKDIQNVRNADLLIKEKEEELNTLLSFSENCAKRRSYTSDKCRSTKR